MTTIRPLSMPGANPPEKAEGFRVVRRHCGMTYYPEFESPVSRISLVFSQYPDPDRVFVDQMVGETKVYTTRKIDEVLQLVKEGKELPES